MPGKLFLIMVCVALTSCERNSPTHASQSTATTKIRGESIDPASPVAAVEVRDATRRRHPRPPSTQRRMVLAEMVLLGQTNSASLAMPSGTKGTAADLAKTNLPSAGAVPGLDLVFPGYREVSFSTLASFDFVLAKGMADGSEGPADISTKAEMQIPADVRALDGSKAVIEGFLLPVKMNDGLAVEFLLMRNQSMCCYGVPPKITEWITVDMNGKGVKPVMDQPISVAGVLHVGPIEENGCLAGIYRLDGEKVIAPF